MKTKKILAWVLSLVMILTLLPAAAFADTYAGGLSSGYYLVGSFSEWFAQTDKAIPLTPKDGNIGWIEDVALTQGDTCKIVWVNGSGNVQNECWYGRESDNQDYEVPSTGHYTIYLNNSYRLYASKIGTTEHPAVGATCTTDGNIQYWTCDVCGQCFSDAAGTTEITQAETVVPATGNHTYVDGVCSVCHAPQPHTVRFYKTGTLVGTQTVLHGQTASAPADVTLAGDEFWSIGESVNWAVFDFSTPITNDLDLTVGGSLTGGGEGIGNDGIYYYKNDGTDTYFSEPFTALDYYAPECRWTRQCYRFVEWNDDPQGNGTSVSPGTELDIDGGEKFYAIWAPDHTLTAHPATAATCTTPGNTAYWECSVCHKYFSDEEGENEIDENSWVVPQLVAVAQIGETKYETLNAAFDAVTDGDTIKLLGNVTQDIGFLFNQSGVSAKLNLNNFTITVNNGSNVNNRAIKIQAGTLEVYGGSIVAVGSGTTSGNGSGCYGAFRVEVDGKLIAHDLTLSNARPWGLNVKVLGGEAELTNVTINSSYGGGIEVTEADLGTGSKAGKATLTNCTFTQSNYFDHCSSAVTVSGGSELIVNSGAYTGEVALYVFSSGGVITVNGGTFTGSRKAFVAAIDTVSYPQYTGGFEIKGGTFNGVFDITSPAFMAISGGTFDNDPNAYLAEGYDATAVNDVWTVAAHIPEIAKPTDTSAQLTATIDAGYLENATGEVTIDGTVADVTFNAAAVQALADLGELTLTVVDTTAQGVTASKTFEITLKNTSNNNVFTQASGNAKATVTVPFAVAEGKIPQVYLVEGQTKTAVTVVGYTATTVTFEVPHFSVYSVETADIVASFDEGGVTKYATTLAEAIAGADANSTVTLLADTRELEDGSELTIDKAITITGPVDAKGEPLYTIYGKSSATGTNDIFITGNRDVTLSNLNIKNFGNGANTDSGHAPVYVSQNYTGTVTLENLHISDFNRGGIFLYGGTFNVKDCDINCANSRTGAFTKGIEIKGTAHGTIVDTSIYNMERSSSASDAPAGIEIYGRGSVVVNRCTIISDCTGHTAGKATYGIVSSRVGEHDPSGGSLLVKDTTIITTNGALSVADNDDYGPVNNYIMTVEGSSFDNYIATWSGSSSITINSGEFAEDVYAYAGTIIIHGGNFTNFLPDTDTGSIVIDGGTFDAEVPAEYCADGYIPAAQDPVTGLYSVKSGSYVAEIEGGAKYESLADAIAAVPTTGVATTITMLADEALAAGVTVAAGQNIVLELNGKTISETLSQSGTSALITNIGTLTIQDNTDTGKNGTGTGKITYVNANPDSGSVPGYASNTIINNGNLTIKSGYIENTTTGGYAAYTIDNLTNGNMFTPVLTVEGGKLYNSYTDAIRMFLNSDSKLNKVVITGGVIDSAKQSGRVIVIHDPNAKVNKGELDISGGEIQGTINAWSAANAGGVEDQFSDAQYDTLKINISGGYIEKLDFDSMANVEKRLESLVITGGQYANNPSAYLSPEYLAEDTATGTYNYTIGGPYVAQIGNVGYETLAAAVAAAQDGDTIKLLASSTGAGLFIGQNKFTTTGLTIDFNGKTYTVETPVGSPGTVNQALHFEQGNKITLTSSAETKGTINVTNDATELAAFQMVMQNYGELTIEGMVINGTGIAIARYDDPKYQAYPGWYQTEKPQFNYNTAGSSVIRNSTITMPGALGVDDAAVLLIEDDAVINVSAIATKGTDDRYASATSVVNVENDAKFTLSGNGAAAAFEAYLAAKGQSLGTPVNGVYTVETLKVAQIVRGAETLKFASLAEAVTAAQAGDTITLLTDVTLTAPQAITTALTLDLGGNTISNNGSGYAFEITNAAVTIKDGTINGTGKGIKATGSSANVTLGAANEALTVSATGRALGLYDHAAATLAAGSTLTTSVSGDVTVFLGAASTFNVYGTVSQTNDGISADNNAISGNGNQGNGGTTLRIYSGAAVSSAGSVAAAIYQPQAGTTIIDGGDISGATAIYQKCGTLTINGGSITGNGSAAAYNFNGNGGNSTGDALVVDSCNYPGGAPTTVINGGTFASTNGVAVGYYEANTTAQGYQSGTVNANVNTLTVPEGYKWVAQDTNPVTYLLTECDYVAQINNGAKYESLAEAFAEATADDTIKLLENVTADAIVINKALTLDMNGKTITATLPCLFDITANGALTITGNGTINGPAHGENYDSKAMINVAGTLTYVNGTLNATGSGSDGMYGVYILQGGTAVFGDANNGPTIHSHFAAIGMNHMTAPAYITVNGGTYTADATPTNNEWWYYFCAPIYAAASGTLTINGGTFNGYYGISDRYADVEQTLTITGGTFNASSNIAIFADEVNGSNDTANRTIEAKTNNLSVPEGYKWVEYGNGYVLAECEYVAEIEGGAKYESLAEAVAAAQTGNTITLLDDVTITSPQEIRTNLTLDLAGHKIERAGNCVLDIYSTVTLTDSEGGGEVKGGVPVWLNGTANFTLAGGTLTAVTENNGTGYGIIAPANTVLTMTGGTITAVDCGIFATNDANVTISGGSITAHDYAISTNGSASGDNESADVVVAINGGTLTSTHDVAVYIPAGCFTISGGTITGATAVYQKSGALSITGGSLIANGAAADFVHSGDGCNATGDALVVENCSYPNGAPAATISGNPTITSTNGVQIAAYAYGNDATTGEPREIATVTATTNNLSVPEGYKWEETETAGVYELVPVQEIPAATVIGSTLMLNGTILVNFYMSIPAESEADYVTLTINGRETKIAVENGIRDDAYSQYLRFDITTYAKEMGDTIYLRVYDVYDNLLQINTSADQTTLIDVYTYSVDTYLESAKNAIEYANLPELAVAMMGYGDYAAWYFQNRDGNSSLNDRTPVVPENLDAYAPVPSDGVLGTTSILGGSLILEEAVTIRVYLSEYNADYTYSYSYIDKNNNNKEHALDASQIDPAYNLHYVEITDVAAQDLDIMYTFKISDGNNTYTYQYSALSYVRAVLNSNAASQTLRDLVVMVYNYNQAANTYFDNRDNRN